MKKLVPFGDRILVKRRKIGNKIGSGILEAPDEVSDRLTEIAEVVYVPDNSFADNNLIAKADVIVGNLSVKAESGDVDALKMLLEFNYYLKIKSLKPGDTVFIGKYVGTDISIKETGELLTLVSNDGIIAKVVEK